jgi:heme/copper-type cytochrome/quinol oxidase subunit 2
MTAITFAHGWKSLGGYVALGLLYQLATGDGPFSWVDPWTWITMFLWPFFLLGWIVTVSAGVLVVVFLFFLYSEHRTTKKKQPRTSIAEHNEERRRQLALRTPPSKD